MKTGSRGTFVISWSQTEIDGLAAGPLDALAVGASWRWTGKAVQVDAGSGPLILEGAEGVAETRKRAARMVRRLIGAAVSPRSGGEGTPDLEDDTDLPDQGFIVTDGHQSCQGR